VGNEYSIEKVANGYYQRKHGANTKYFLLDIGKDYVQ